MSDPSKPQAKGLMSSGRSLSRRAPTSATVKRPTVRDVARMAGVAVGTVSRVVNGIASVTDESRHKVLDAIEQLAWTPSVAAQTMRGVTSPVIGFIFSDIRNPLYSAMVKGAEAVFSEHGYILMVASSDGSSSKEMALISLFKRRADGLIFSIENERNKEVISAVKSSKLALVLLERELEGTYEAVSADHFSGTRQATEYLLSLGHRRIALITGGKTNFTARLRIGGMRLAFEQAGLQVSNDMIKSESFASEYALRQTQLFLESERPPTAILALGSHILSGVLQAVRLKRLSIPQDISIIASNDSELAQLATPAISVIRYDAVELGRQAALALLRQIRDKELPTGSRVQVQTELVVRESCARVSPTKQ
jgi:LacI family transcriptional regulator